jgi:hypothetical protein
MDKVKSCTENMRLKLGGGQAYNLSSNLAVVVDWDKYGIICSASPGLTRELVHIVNIVYITNYTYYKQLYLLDSDS